MFEEGEGIVARLKNRITALEQEVTGVRDALRKADKAWQASESRLAHICQLLGVDYTCEEPETCEQVIERMKENIAELKGKLDIIVREGTGEPPDSLAADYGGTDWEKSPEVCAVRAERLTHAKLELECSEYKKAVERLTAERDDARFLTERAVSNLCETCAREL